MATRLGTSSPNISVMYESISVMTTTDIACNVSSFTVTPSEMSHETRREAKLSAANALPRKPESVIAI